MKNYTNKHNFYEPKIEMIIKIMGTILNKI